LFNISKTLYLKITVVLLGGAEKNVFQKLFPLLRVVLWGSKMLKQELESGLAAKLASALLALLDGVL